MASVKREQILQEAEKLAARGKLDAAVREYRRALEQGPADTTALNRLGDLLVRANRIDEAVDVYQRIAEHFASDGFFLKGIAIYKKVNRLDPQRTDIYERLADLYFKQGLVVEGRQQLVTLADWFLRSRRVEEAIRTYRKLVELEPANFQARAKLLDLLIQVGDVREVGVQIEALSRALLGRGMLEEAVKLCHRALELGPAAADAIAPCVDALVTAGRPQDALNLAESAVRQGGSASALRQALARSLAEAGEHARARVLLEELLPEVGENTRIVQLYGDVMLQAGEVSLAKDKVLPAVDRLLAAGDRNRAESLVKRLLRAAPGDAEVLERALKVLDRRSDPDLVETVEAALADAYFRAGRRGDAMALYRRLHEREPENRLFARRLNELGVPVQIPATPPPKPTESQPAPPTASKPVVVTPPPSTEESPEIEFVDVDLEAAAMAISGASESFAAIEESPVSAFPGTSLGRGLPEPTLPARAVEEPTGSVPLAEEEAWVRAPSLETNSEELFTEASVFAKYGLTEKAIAHLHRLLALDPGHRGGRQLLAELGGGVLEEVTEEPAPVVVPTPAAAPVPEVAPTPVRPVGSPPKPSQRVPSADGLDLDALLAPLSPASAKPTAAPAARSSLGRVKLEELEAMLGFDPAAKGRRSPGPPRGEVEPQPAPVAPPADTLWGGAAPEAVSFELTLPAAPTAQLGAVEGPPVGFEILAEPPSEPSIPLPGPIADDRVEELVEVADLLAGPTQEQLRELDFFIEQGLREDAGRLLARLQENFGDHPAVLARQALLKGRGWEETERGAAVGADTASELFSEEEQFFDLAAELERELAEDELVAAARGQARDEGEEESIEELFREFQRGVAEQLSEEDYDTHFNLGLAYREMGLLDEAIGEFQLAVKSPALFLEAVSMIGACYVDKGLYDEAAGWYAKGLEAPDLSPEVEVGLHYELARALEAGGSTASALAHYAEVLARNPGFRDVVARIERLRMN